MRDSEISPDISDIYPNPMKYIYYKVFEIKNIETGSIILMMSMKLFIIKILCDS